MRASFRSCSSTLLVAWGTAALLIVVIVVITGGFAFAVGPVRFSSHRWQAPLLMTVLAWSALAVVTRGAVLQAAQAFADLVERQAFRLAVVVAAAAAAVGVAFGTYAASGADAAGYISQTELLVGGSLRYDEPLARAVSWPQATWTFAPLGYRPGAGAGQLVPTYPPGLPLLMAAARLMAGEWAPYFVVPAFAALGVLCAYAIGARWHSRTAGLAGAVLAATSPVFLFEVVQPMSDVPAASLWALAVLLATTRGRGGAAAAGAVAGLAILIRPNLAPLLIPVLLVAGFHRLFWFGAGFTPVAGVLLLINWHLYSNPIASGHGTFAEFYSLANIGPNIRDYWWRLWRGESPLLAVMLGSAAVIAIRGWRRTDTKPSGSADAGFILVTLWAAILVCYLPYGVFPDWSYLRFFMPALLITFAFAGTLLARATAALAPIHAVALLTIVAAAGSFNVNQALREQAFNLHRYEARYRDVGRYMAAAMPPGAVVVAVQESASSYHYAGAPVVRWDLLSVDLDTAVADLAALGRKPVLVVEDWEARDLRARFPASAIARLDWPPRADFGTTTRVRVFDPADRLHPEAVVTDRVP